MAAGFACFTPVWHVIVRPPCSTVIRGHFGCHTLGVNQLVLNGPLDAFHLRVKVAVIAGVIVSSPVWLYQVWAFVAPGLHAREKQWSYLFLGTAVPLFLAGVTLAYGSLGRSMHYLLGLTPGGVSSLIGVDSYLSFAMAMMLAFGIAFEVPLIIIMLLPLAATRVHPGYTVGTPKVQLSRRRRSLRAAVVLVSGRAAYG